MTLVDFIVLIHLMFYANYKYILGQFNTSYIACNLLKNSLGQLNTFYVSFKTT